MSGATSMQGIGPGITRESLLKVFPPSALTETALGYSHAAPATA